MRTSPEAGTTLTSATGAEPRADSMAQTIAASTPQNSSSPYRRSLFNSIPVAALWLPVLYLFAGQWSAYPQYHYGWAVPFLCVYLFYRRHCASLGPAASSDLVGGKRETDTGRLRPGRIFALFALSVLLLPLYVIQEANPIWRAASWGLALCLVGISLLLISIAGGKGALARYAAPVLFFLVAVPWPTALEHLVTELLTRLNTGLTVESLVILGVPALQQGNVIQLLNAVVGVDEACSGIRSTQANLMLALLFGEIYRLSALRRSWLVGFGLAFSILFNWGRTLLLTVVASRAGVDAMNQWHDPAGTVVLLGCFVALWFTGELLRRRTQISRAIVPTSERAGLLFTAPRWLLITLTIWAAFIPVASAWWFQGHESSNSAEPAWQVRWPPSDFPTLESAAISDSARAQLAFDAGGSVRWRDSDGARWQMFYFQWLPADNIFRRVQVQFAKSHRPEICLPATGRVLKEQSIVELDAAGVKIPFRLYRFEDRGQPLHVYLSARDEGMPHGSLANMRSDARERLLAAWHGNRGAGQQTLQFAVWGIEAIAESRGRLEQYLPRFIGRKGSP